MFRNKKNNNNSKTKNRTWNKIRLKIKGIIGWVFQKCWHNILILNIPDKAVYKIILQIFYRMRVFSLFTKSIWIILIIYLREVLTFYIDLRNCQNFYLAFYGKLKTKSHMRKFQSSILICFFARNVMRFRAFLTDAFRARVYLSFVKLFKNFDDGNAFGTNRKSRVVKMRRRDAFFAWTCGRNYRGAL